MKFKHFNVASSSQDGKDKHEGEGWSLTITLIDVDYASYLLLLMRWVLTPIIFLDLDI